MFLVDEWFRCDNNSVHNDFRSHSVYLNNFVLYHSMVYTILIFLCFTIQSFGQWERNSVGSKFYSNFVCQH